ncbi:unnamed protein product [Cuscuta epithymum]|uniref:Uncharacterized protein n=1 Tax=Cuscuta epithymum TaxID=186058 RepID=A0AAV0FF69_9ASTE|nr:unnamed protein product [Cuscuta epithymum]
MDTSCSSSLCKNECAESSDKLEVRQSDSQQIIKQLEERLANNHRVLLQQLDKTTSLTIQLDNEKEIVKKRTLEIEQLTQKVAELTKKVSDTELERNIAKAENEFLHEKRGKLYTKIKELEDLLAKRGQTEQTIFLNQNKDTRFYNSKEGLGLTNPNNLKKVDCIQLYDINYMGLGLTKLMAFTYGKETAEEEEVKRSNPSKAEIPFSYDSLNKSYETAEPVFSSDESVSFYPSEKEAVSDSEPPSTSGSSEEEPYIPPLIRKFETLHISLENQRKSFEEERKNFESERERLLRELTILKESSQSGTTSQSSSDTDTSQPILNKTNIFKRPPTHSTSPLKTENEVSRKLERKREWRLKRAEIAEAKKKMNFVENKKSCSSAAFYSNKSRFSSVTHHSSQTFSNDSRSVFSHSRAEVRKPEKPKQKAKAVKPHCDVNDGKSKKKRFEASTYTVCDGVCLTYPLKVYSAKHLKRLSREKIFTSRKSVPSFTSAENSHTPAITQKWVPKSESQSYSSPKASKETGLGTKIKQKFQNSFCAKRDGPTLKWVPKVS